MTTPALEGFVSAFVDALRVDPTLDEALDPAGHGAWRHPALDLVGPAGVRPFLAAALARGSGPEGSDPEGDSEAAPVLVVVPTAREGELLAAALADLVGEASVAYFPSWETLPHERLSPRSDTVGQRLAILRRLRHPLLDAAAPGTGPLRVVVAPVRSLLQPQAAGLGDIEPVSLRVGQELPLEELVAGLAGAAYSRVDLVEKRGEFAVRGGIVDVFPPTEDHPVRIEFFGDEVEEIRTFAVADQRGLEHRESLWAPPCRELLLTDAVRARAAELGERHPSLLELTDQIAAGVAVEGMEALLPVLVDELELLVDVLPASAQILLVDPERARTRAHDLVATSAEFLAASWAVAAGGGKAPVDLAGASYRPLGEVRSHA
ncbi:MAG: transcription-repair coupling factor, partial [Nocardioides sp.]